jgi:hypothetical protein
MSKKTAGKFGLPGGTLGKLEESTKALADKLDPFSEDAKKTGQIPFYSTGARALVKLGGVPLGVVSDIRWSVSYNATPIQTIDTPFPWDIDVGAVTITATLGQIIDPTKGPESENLFAVMQAAVHQPLVEMQVLDASGTSIFFARGMFTAVNGNIGRGQVGTWSCQFTGVAYQHYVAQSFKPYTGVANAAGTLVNGLKKLASDLSGGIF